MKINYQHQNLNPFKNDRLCGLGYINWNIAQSSRTALFIKMVLTLVNVVDPEAMRICRILLWNLVRLSSSTLRKHWAVLSLVTSFCKFHTPSLWVNSSLGQRHLGRIRHSNPDMLNNRLGLSLLKLEIQVYGQCACKGKRRYSHKYLRNWLRQTSKEGMWKIHHPW